MTGPSQHQKHFKWMDEFKWMVTGKNLCTQAIAVSIWVFQNIKRNFYVVFFKSGFSVTHNLLVETVIWLQVSHCSVN